MTNEFKTPTTNVTTVTHDGREVAKPKLNPPKFPSDLKTDKKPLFWMNAFSR